MSDMPASMYIILLLNILFPTRQDMWRSQQPENVWRKKLLKQGIWTAVLSRQPGCTTEESILFFFYSFFNFLDILEISWEKRTWKRRWVGRRKMKRRVKKKVKTPWKEDGVKKISKEEKDVWNDKTIFRHQIWQSTIFNISKNIVQFYINYSKVFLIF